MIERGPRPTRAGFLKNVYLHKSGKYRATVRHQKKLYCVPGLFWRQSQCAAAVKEFRARLVAGNLGQK